MMVRFAPESRLARIFNPNWDCRLDSWLHIEPIRPDIEDTSIYELGIFEMLNRDFNFGIEMTRLVTSTPSISFLLSLTYYYR